MTSLPARLPRPEETDRAFPLYAVWELTLRCDQPCDHCGSRAGRARTEELETEAVLSVGTALARLGCREVVLIGGEAYLRPDLVTIVAHLAGLGLRVVIQTGGRAFTRERARELRSAGLAGLGVSVDGPAPVHDRLRGNLGSHAAALRALDAANEVGLFVSANTQVNRLNKGALRAIARDLRAHGVRSWQVQLTVPMGRAADRPEWILEPWDVVGIVDTLAAIQYEAAAEPEGIRFVVNPGNNLGYFGPHEVLLRSLPNAPEAHWEGCRAGIHVIGIESDGTVKGCPSLPTAPYAGGNVRELDLASIWERSEVVRFARDRTLDELWGYCASCYYRVPCRAGCSWTAHALLGRRGNNPFCYHRATDLRRKGRRERLVPCEPAPGQPYDFGRFELVEEAWFEPASTGNEGLGADLVTLRRKPRPSA
ncbi:heme biosynthesis protein [Minicystis rosea]|nr:heme biosynthesis protein [Minicystis rosea]